MLSNSFVDLEFSACEEGIEPAGIGISLLTAEQEN
jgi:hypothetical protein